MMPDREAAAASERGAELSERARTIGVIGWCSFLAAAGATMVCFAFVDPEALRGGDSPQWWADRMTIYALGFFLFWLTGAAASALALYLARPRSEA